MKLPPAPWQSFLAFLLAGTALASDLTLPEAAHKRFGAEPAPAVKEKSKVKTESPAATASKLVKFGDERTVKACKISLDETRLLLVTSDGLGHAVDLRTGKLTSHGSQIDVRDWPDSFTTAGASPIGADADMYFDSSRNMILKFSDPKFKYGVGGGANQFVSFTSSSGQIIVYNRGAAELKRLEIPLGTVVWNLKLPQEVKNKTAQSFTSPDYVWMVLTLGDHSFLIHLREGRSVQTVGAPKSPAQFGSRWLRIPGEQESILYSLPDVRRRDDPRMKTAGIRYFDDESGVSVLDDRQVQFTSGEPVELAAPALAALVLNPARHMVVLEDGLSQLRLINLENHESSGVGKSYDSVFNPANSCFAASSTRSLFALAHGSEVEVFWSAFVGAGNFRSLVLALPTK